MIIFRNILQNKNKVKFCLPMTYKLLYNEGLYMKVLIIKL